MQRWCVVVLLAVAVPLTAGCLGTLPRDPAVEQITRAPGDALHLPLREDRRYWLLRSQPGFVSAHEARFGGDPEDSAVLVVRAVRFDDIPLAARAFARLTPEYIHRVLRDRMTGLPRLFTYPTELPGDESTVSLYGVRLPPEWIGVQIEGQMTTLRAGRVVLLIESIGVMPDRLVPALDDITRAARELGDGCWVMGVGC